MAIAIVPAGTTDFKGRRNSWVNLSKADDLIREYFGVRVDPEEFYLNWPSDFRCFNWKFTPKGSDYAYPFLTEDDAINHCIKVFRNMDLTPDQFIIDCIKAIYSNGLIIVSLDIA